MMKQMIKIYLCDEEGQRFFGEGPYRLLLGIEKTGSLRAAAAELGMAYTKALKLLGRAEQVLGYALTERKTGGRGGGGSSLTAEARLLMERYDAYQSACRKSSRELFALYFGKTSHACEAGVGAGSYDTEIPAGCVPDSRGQRADHYDAGIPAERVPDSRSQAADHYDAGIPAERVPVCRRQKPDTPVLAAAVLASGSSSRFGANKLLAEFRGEALLVSVLRLAQQPLFAGRVAVTRTPEAERLCRERAFPCILHELPSKSDSIRLALGELQRIQPDGCLFLQADQPLVTERSLYAMAQEFREHPDCILRLSFRGRAGSPVLFPKALFGELAALSEGESGAAVIRRYPERVRLVEAQHESELWDADTPEALQRLAQAGNGLQ